MKILQSRPQLKSLNINYYDLYYTVIINRNENEVVKDGCEIDYINFNDFITPNHHIGRKNDSSIMR